MSDLRDEIKVIWDSAVHPLADLWDWAKEPKKPEERAKRWDALAEWAGSHKRQQEHDSDEWKAWRKRQRVYRNRAERNRDDASEPEVPGIEDGGWHPDARRVGVVTGIGPLQGGRKIVWHTTEGYGLPAYSGSNPHFTLDPKTGTLYQHQDVRQGARALQNLSGGVETNRQGAIQVELIGFASQSQSWTEEAYQHIADLARWIEHYCGVQRECSVSFPGNGQTAHMDATKWNSYNGHCGHCNVPENAHWDPGRLNIAAVLDK